MTGMAVHQVDDVERLKKINAALISRVERSMDQQGNAFSLFQTAINLENRIKSRTEELHATMRRLEQTNIDLIAAKEAAEQANISKTRFLAAASHDVLQPLNAAHLSVSALADLQSSPEGTRLVRQVERSLDTMDELLRTLLDISKLDAGVVKPDYSELSIEQLFQSLRSDFQPLAEKKGLRLRFRPTNLSLTTDRSLFRRIVQNIISNAIRYTGKGGVLVAVRPRKASARIEIWDTGCGIPENQTEKVFEEFHRGVTMSEGALSGAGLGLGLAIVKRMADTLGYRVTLKSKPGKGTVFRIDMPAGSFFAAKPTANASEVETPKGYGLFGAKVLLVENDPNVLESMRTLLERWQCSVRIASTTEQAMGTLGDTDWVPDIVIADQHLDDGDLGTATITEARAYVGRDIPALVVTADPSDLIVKATSELGIELMHKPVKPAQLRALLAHLLA
jgi:signal transduction histidine kinase